MEPDLVFFDEIEEWPQLTRRASLQRGTGTTARIADPAPQPDPKEVIFKGKSMPRAPDEWDRDLKMHLNMGLLDELVEDGRTGPEDGRTGPKETNPMTEALQNVDIRWEIEDPDITAEEIIEKHA